MTSLTGTWAMLRLALRRDRVLLPLWLVVLGGLLAAQVEGIDTVYDTPREQVAYASVTASSIAARLFGSVDGPTFGSILMVEIYGFLSVLTALMSSMLVVRHTRQNEQAGRIDLVGSTVVGRHASLAAALLLSLLVNVILAIVYLGVLLVTAPQLPTSGAAAMALGIAGCGISFAAVAALTSQVAASSRGANALAGLLLAGSFLVRAAGDVAGSTSSDGMHVVIAWPSWLSPLGWGQLAYPFGDLHWLPILLSPVFAAVTAAAAITIAARRDIGSGLLPQRRGAARASALLSSPLGLAVRLERGLWLGWLLGVVIVGATFGAFAGEVDTIIAQSPEAMQMFGALGGTDTLTDAYYAYCIGWMATIITGFAVQVVLRLREEELEGAIESLLATPVARTRWYLSHVVVAAVGSLLLLMAMGVATGAVALVSDGAGAGIVVDMVVASLVQLPAVLVVAGVAALAWALDARRGMVVGWSMVALSVVVMIGEMLQLPDAMLQLSPFTHTPLMPADPWRSAPVIALAAVAAVLFAAGSVALRNRDVGGA